jgi:hypothetical protein
VTDLERFQGPRDGGLVERFVRQIEPTYGFVLYGVLYFFVSSAGGLAGMFLALLIQSVLGLSPDSATVTILAIGFSLAGWIAAWLPFAWWVRGKRRRARELVRDGVLCDAFVATSSVDKAVQAGARVAMAMAGGAHGVHWERVELEHGGVTYTGLAPFSGRPAPGAPVHVLVKPHYGYALAFAPDGQALVTKIRRR